MALIRGIWKVIRGIWLFVFIALLVSLVLMLSCMAQLLCGEPLTGRPGRLSRGT